MAVIKEGYNSKPLEIKVYANSGRMAEVWTEMFDGTKATQSMGINAEGYDPDDSNLRTEVLHYATITELIELRDEINIAIKELAGV